MNFIIVNVLGKKKAVIVSCIITVSCCVIAYIIYYYSTQTLYFTIRQSFETRAIDNSRLLAEVFNEKLMAIKVIAKVSEIQTMDWAIQKNELIKLSKTLGVKTLRVSDKKGLTKTTDGYVTNQADMAYFKEAISGIPNISDVLINKVDNSLTIVYATSIIDKSDNIVGVLSYAEDSEILSQIISQLKSGQKGYATLINKKGVTITHPKKDRILSNETIFKQVKKDSSLKDLAFLENKAINGDIGTGFYKYNGIKKFMAFAPVADTNWSITLTIPSNEIFSIINSTRLKFIIVTIIFILIALVFHYLVLIYSYQRKKGEELKRQKDGDYKTFIQITEMEKLKSEFFINLSHDLKTPLYIILSTLQLLDMYPIVSSDKKLEKHLKIIKQNSFILLRLINNIIDINRIDSCHLQLNLQNCNIIEVVENITSSVLPYLETKSISFTFNTDIKDLRMACDVDKIERVILNLLSNAIKFTKPGGTININLHNTKENFIITVADTGIGIPSDKIGIIFERFRQIDPSLLRENEGSGIGLSVVKSFVDLHNGEIFVESKFGTGSKFIIMLPVKLINTSELPDNIDKDTRLKQMVNIEFSDIR